MKFLNSTNVKKIKFNLLAIIGMMVAVGTVAFTAPRQIESDQWYEITFNDDDSYLKDELGSVTTDPTQGSACSSITEEVRCAVKVSNPDNRDLEGMTLEEAINLDPQITVEEHTFRPL